jgi:hypothetical protein
VPDCPNVKLLEERLAQVLGGRQDVTVSRQVIADQDEAARRGMHGSPTILVDGVDPFAGPGQSASVSCRLYRDGDSQLDGAVEATELSDVAELGELQAIEAQLAELLAADDVDHLAAAMEPGSTAGVLIWENLWAAPFAAAARRSGGQLIANGRIPIQAIIASIEADQATVTAGD